jgi:hypothetical protein
MIELLSMNTLMVAVSSYPRCDSSRKSLALASISNRRFFLITLSAISACPKVFFPSLDLYFVRNCVSVVKLNGTKVSVARQVNS